MATVRSIGFWIIGSVCVFLGALIAGAVEPVLGATPGSIALAYIIAFVLILVGGMLWITVATIKD
jgi:hypothetical protein